MSHKWYWRIGSAVFFVLLGWAGKAGFRVVEMWDDLMFLLQWSDCWFRDSASPTLVVIAAIGIFSFTVVPIFKDFAIDHLFNKGKREFETAFRSTERQRGRQNFARNFEAAYRLKNPDAASDDLVKLIDGAKFPDNFPPKENEELYKYVESIAWPNDASRALWEYCLFVFGDALHPKQTQSKLDPTYYENFLEGRRVTSKFWDDWGREIERGLIRFSQISKQYRANQRDIKALAFSELALATILRWDRGPGKTWLFRLALDPATLTKRGWVMRRVHSLFGSPNGNSET